MKRFTMLPVLWLCLVLFVGCRKQGDLKLESEQMAKQATYIAPEELMRMFLGALEGQTYATNVASRFEKEFNEAVVSKLMREPVGELRRKLETLERQSNRHSYTEAQLQEALRRKERGR